MTIVMVIPQGIATAYRLEGAMFSCIGGVFGIHLHTHKIRLEVLFLNAVQQI